METDLLVPRVPGTQSWLAEELAHGSLGSQSIHDLGISRLMIEDGMMIGMVSLVRSEAGSNLSDHLLEGSDPRLAVVESPFLTARHPDFQNDEDEEEEDLDKEDDLEDDEDEEEFEDFEEIDEDIEMDDEEDVDDFEDEDEIFDDDDDFDRDYDGYDDEDDEDDFDDEEDDEVD